MEKTMTMFEGISRFLERSPASTPSTLPENISTETPKTKTEIRLENINTTISMNIVQIKSLDEQLKSIKISNFDDKQHPGFQADMILRDGLIKAIEKLERTNQELEKEKMALESGEQVTNIN